MSDDIEEFLRRAAARRQQRQQQGQRPGHAPPRPPDIEIIEQPIEADIVEAEVSESIADHVSHYLGTQDFGERASHMGEEVGLADEHLEAHLSEAFEHRVGDLGAATSQVEMKTYDSLAEGATSVQRGRSGAADLVKMFRTPTSMQQAILLSEIMRRPLDRW